MSIKAINTARLQNPLSANVVGGNATADSQAVRGERVQDQRKLIPKSRISDALKKALNDDMEAIHRVGLQFSVHEDTGQTVVRVVDKDTGELIRQIPPQELLDLASKLEDMMGILFDKQV
jgi:flagellar protein FlaG